MEPAFVSGASADDLKSSAQREQDAREMRRRARHRQVALKDREDVKCHRCGLPIRARLNVNRFDVEDELLGAQFQNQYDVLCECDPESGSTSSDDAEPELTEADVEAALEAEEKAAALPPGAVIPSRADLAANDAAAKSPPAKASRPE